MARAIATSSASPLATISSAWAGSVMNPTAIVGMTASARTAAAKGTWNPGPHGIFAFGNEPPLETSMKSQPRFLSSRANATVSSRVQPPSAQSVAETRAPTGMPWAD